MQGTHGGGTGGWRHGVYQDMTNPNTNCPSGWNLTGYKATCGRATDGSKTFDSLFFPVSGGPYSQVCGRMRAYNTNMDYQMPSLVMTMVDKLQSTAPISVVLL